MKRKLSDVGGEGGSIAGTPANKRLRSILKSTDSPRSPNRSVCFQPPDNVGDILAKIVDGKVVAGQLETILAELEASKGPALVLWLQGLTEHVHKLDSELQGLVSQVLQLSWADQSQEVVASYRQFLLSLLSAHPVYTRAVIRSLLKKFTPQNAPVSDERQDAVQEVSLASQNIHEILQDILKRSKEARGELVRQLNQTFPFFKHPPSKLIPFTRAATAIAKYIGREEGGQTAVLEILLEKVIRLDASLSREDIRRCNESGEESENDEEEEEEAETAKAAAQAHQPLDPLLSRMVVSLDLSMAALFELVESEMSTPGDDGDSSIFSENLLRLFETHILPTHNICHLQYLIFYAAGQNKKLSKKFMRRTWDIFRSFTTASILRQAAIAYLSGYLCRALVVKSSTMVKYLRKIIKWIHNYLGHDRTLNVDYMHVNLAAHGPFYSACQAACYIIAFRHSELAPNDDLTFLRSLQLNTIVSHQLNPLRVMQAGVVKEFSKIVSHYQLAYCKAVLERNRRITLPVVGLSSSGSTVAKPLLLDNYFPFDPYCLPRTRRWVKPFYRRFEPILDDETESSEDEEEEREQEGEQEDGGAVSEEELIASPPILLSQSRSRSISFSSNASGGGDTSATQLRRRSRKLSVSDIILQEIDNL